MVDFFEYYVEIDYSIETITIHYDDRKLRQSMFTIIRVPLCHISNRFRSMLLLIDYRRL